ATDAMRGFFDVWANTSVRELLDYMCSYNRAHRQDPLHFFGFDIQQACDDAPLIGAFLRRVAPARAGLLLDGLSTCNGVDSSDRAACYQAMYNPTTDDAYGRCKRGIAAIRQYVGQNRQVLRTRIGEADLG